MMMMMMMMMMMITITFTELNPEFLRCKPFFVLGQND